MVRQNVVVVKCAYLLACQAGEASKQNEYELSLTLWRQREKRDQVVWVKKYQVIFPIYFSWTKASGLSSGSGL
jgi:hypothetical protein